MDKREAKEILSSVCRIRDEAADPLVAGALEQVRLDPELAHWWEQLQEADKILREKLQAIEIPPFLDRQILSAARDVEPSRWWKILAAPKLIAPFAAAAVVIVGLWSIQPQPAAFGAYRSEMVAAVSVPYEMDVEAHDFADLRRGFAEAGWPSDYRVSSALQATDVEGGLLRTWRGKKVSVLCLETERETGGTGHGAIEEKGTGDTGHGADHEEDLYLWLFVVDRSALPDLSETGTAIEKVDELMTVAWAQGKKAYLLVDDGDERSLRAFRQKAGERGHTGSD
ncbi:MAG: hypothetical protein HRU01_03385 [Myxococcales bacterium]|nr:hypothetical protein [Myxococcales bacterium]